MLLHRGSEIQQLSHALKHVAFDADGGGVLLTGPSGVWKTALSRYTLQKLHEEYALRHLYVRTLDKKTGTVLLEMLEELGVDAHNGLSLAERQRRLREATDDPLLVVLDEADDIPETDVLGRVADVPATGVVCIPHDSERRLSRLDQSGQTRFRGGRGLDFQRYEAHELADILERRADKGLYGEPVTRQLLRQIADESASVARRAIQTLYAAAEIATERGHDTITPLDVDDGRERARCRLREANLASLPWHHHVLYEIVRRGGDRGVTGVALHESYDDHAGTVYRDVPTQPIGERSRRNKLRKLVEYDLIEQDGEGSGVRYRVLDRTVASDQEPLEAVSEAVLALDHT